MLKNIDPLLSPDLLQMIAAMGHGDEIVVADANFPATASARRLVAAPGVDAISITKAILSLFPLDTFVPAPAAMMRQVSGPVPDIYAEFQQVLDEAEGRPVKAAYEERLAFYDRAADAFGIVATGERRFYGNIILKKGAVAPDA